MESLKLSAKETMEKLNWTKSKVYNWMRLGKFETVDSPKGKLIVITQAQLDELKDLYSDEVLEGEFDTVGESSNFSEYQNQSNSLEQPALNVMSRMLDMLEANQENNLAQVKLLEDSEHRTKNEFFELKVKYQTLSNQFEELQKQYQTVLKENLELKKPWYKRKKLD